MHISSLSPIALPVGLQLRLIRQHATRLPWKPICEWNISWNKPPPPHTNTHRQTHKHKHTHISKHSYTHTQACNRGGKKKRHTWRRDMTNLYSSGKVNKHWRTATVFCCHFTFFSLHLHKHSQTERRTSKTLSFLIKGLLLCSSASEAPGGVNMWGRSCSCTKGFGSTLRRTTALIKRDYSASSRCDIDSKERRNNLWLWTRDRGVQTSFYSTSLRH